MENQSTVAAWRAAATRVASGGIHDDAPVKDSTRALDMVNDRLSGVVVRVGSLLESSRGAVDRHFGPRPEVPASNEIRGVQLRPSSTIASLNLQLDQINELIDRLQGETGRLLEL